MGRATMIWDTISGGVMMADTTNISTMAGFWAFFSQELRMTPSQVSTTEITGSSNTQPKTRNTVSKKEI